MKNRVREFSLALALLVVSLAPALATDQKWSDRIVGHWVSSSGTPVTLAYSGKPETFLVQIRLPHEPVKSMVATWVDGTRFTYRASDGTVINGWVHDEDSISVSSSTSSWRAEWTRR